jgi:Skp family chaperone for outer membrane proteins
MIRQLFRTCRPSGNRTLLAACAVGMALTAAPASAVMYKWVDANGRITYSDQPPTGNMKIEVVNGAPPAANTDAVREMANQEAELKKRLAQRADEQKNAAKSRADTVAKQQACTEARSQVRVYDSDLLIARVNEKGEQVFLDESMKRQERERLEAIARKRCAG